MIWDLRWRQIPGFRRYFISEDNQVVDSVRKRLVSISKDRGGNLMVDLIDDTGRRVHRRVNNLRVVAFSSY